MMKRMICFILMLCLLLPLVCMNVFAEETLATEPDDGMIPDTGDGHRVLLLLVLLLVNLAALGMIGVFCMKKGRITG